MADVAVIGIPDDYAGEVPKAFVVLVDPSKAGPATTTTLLEFVKGKKSRPKWLAGGIEFVEAVPKSASGKLLRRVLRDQVRQKKKSEAAKL